jgi:hypothetical protein
MHLALQCLTSSDTARVIQVHEGTAILLSPSSALLLILPNHLYFPSSLISFPSLFNPYILLFSSMSNYSLFLFFLHLISVSSLSSFSPFQLSVQISIFLSLYLYISSLFPLFNFRYFSFFSSFYFLSSALLSFACLITLHFTLPRSRYK